MVAYDLFNDISLPINSDFINLYLFNRLKEDDSYSKFKSVHMYNNYYTNEVSKLSVFNSYIKLKSNFYDNTFINNLKEITNLFVCDFMYDKYKFLNHKKSVKKIK